jgi:hypothetical protein
MQIENPGITNNNIGTKATNTGKNTVNTGMAGLAGGSNNVKPSNMMSGFAPGGSLTYRVPRAMRRNNSGFKTSLV